MKKEMPCPTILLVDDDPIIRKILRRIILKFYPNAAIHESADGMEAGEQMVNMRPSLIVLDINMPRMNGLEVCSQIRQDPSTKDINILMVTGDSADGAKESAFKAGADAFLIKPIVGDLFLKTVSELLTKAQDPAECAHRDDRKIER